MPRKEIKFNMPSWLAVNLGAIKYTLDGLTGFGIGSEMAQPNIQAIPIVTLLCFLGGRYIGYVMKTYVQQGIMDDDGTK